MSGTGNYETMDMPAEKVESFKEDWTLYWNDWQEIFPDKLAKDSFVDFNVELAKYKEDSLKLFVKYQADQLELFIKHRNYDK